MSRIGKKPITIPAGVTATVNGNTITVKGPKGTLTREFDSAFKCELNGNELNVVCPENAPAELQAKHGLYRSLINNMVVGVHEGFSKNLVVNGVGWKVTAQGNKIVLSIGLSHIVEVTAPDGIKFECPSLNDIVVSGCDKELVGQTCADIMAKRPLEPYHGYGIRLKEQVVILKEGKKAGK